MKTIKTLVQSEREKVYLSALLESHGFSGVNEHDVPNVGGYVFINTEDMEYGNRDDVDGAVEMDANQLTIWIGDRVRGNNTLSLGLTDNGVVVASVKVTWLTPIADIVNRLSVAIDEHYNSEYVIHPVKTASTLETLIEGYKDEAMIGLFNSDGEMSYHITVKKYLVY